MQMTRRRADTMLMRIFEKSRRYRNHLRRQWGRKYGPMWDDYPSNIQAIHNRLGQWGGSSINIYRGTPTINFIPWLRKHEMVLVRFRAHMLEFIAPKNMVNVEMATAMARKLGYLGRNEQAEIVPND